ncbi:hypothetical protein [Acidithiobacillus thiooxidans]|uniref:hypothetical protein n=1 Tax=Acidithiobacillus thiooxidans TaxID=930 RepID=UPI0009DAFE25|nr:hypothetical protein [Acidithiobacillus thiooxidans]
MGTMEGFLMGQALAPNHDTGPEWEARAMREEARKNQALAQVQKLSADLEKEHKRFLIERRERKEYMRGWQTRGAILRENCGYTSEKIKEEAKMFGEKYDEKYTRISKETDAEIDAEAGF